MTIIQRRHRLLDVFWVVSVLLIGVLKQQKLLSSNIGLWAVQGASFVQHHHHFGGGDIYRVVSADSSRGDTGSNDLDVDVGVGTAFHPFNNRFFSTSDSRNTILGATKTGSGGKRRKRRRKVATDEPKPTTVPTTTSPEPIEVSQASSPPDGNGEKTSGGPIFEDSTITMGIEDDQEKDQGLSVLPSAQASTETSLPPLPDIRDVLKKKQIEEDLARIQKEKEASKVRIKRSDTAAFNRLLEQSPYNDSDDTLFEEEKYTTVSALLGEGSKPFLGIPTGPLQVGHFVGALGITLMAFVEYPGFPLTNLPDPLRGALAGGLGTVYSINILLTVLAFFKAGERGQPAFLWMSKTLSVGGLALDQLTQLPTLEEIEADQVKNSKYSRKGSKRR